jgi:hypothetical protein
MTAIGRVTMLDLRTVAPYRLPLLLAFASVVAIMANRPVVLVPALVLLVTSSVAAQPFLVADKARLETLYAVLPLSRRSVLNGHYAWALMSFVATATAGTALALLLARIQGLPFGGGTLLTVLALAWGFFAVNTAIQFPLFIRFGYSRINLWGTTVPLTLVTIAAVRMHLPLGPVRIWAVLLGVAGTALFVTSAAAAGIIDRWRIHKTPDR